MSLPLISGVSCGNVTVFQPLPVYKPSDSLERMIAKTIRSAMASLDALSEELQKVVDPEKLQMIKEKLKSIEDIVKALNEMLQQIHKIVMSIIANIK